jgi:hypothetical protein
LKRNRKVQKAAGFILAIAAVALSLSITGHNFQRAQTANALSPVAQVFVTKQNGDVEKVIVSSGVHTVIANTGVGTADSLTFEPSGKLLVTGESSSNVYRIDPNLPGGAGNTPIPPIPVNATPFSPAFAADPAIDGAGNVLITDFANTVNVVNLTTGAVTPHPLTGLSGIGGIGISGISFDAAGQLWVTDLAGDTVGIANLSLNTYTPLCTLPGQNPDGLSFDPTTGKLYVSGITGQTLTQMTIGLNSCTYNPTPFPGGDVYPVAPNCLSPDGVAADGQAGVFIACLNGTITRVNLVTGAHPSIATGITLLDDIAPVFGFGAPPPAGSVGGTVTITSVGSNPVFPTLAVVAIATVTLSALAAGWWLRCRSLLG